MKILIILLITSISQADTIPIWTKDGFSEKDAAKEISLCLMKIRSHGYYQKTFGGHVPYEIKSKDLGHFLFKKCMEKAGYKETIVSKIK